MSARNSNLREKRGVKLGGALVGLTALLMSEIAANLVTPTWAHAVVGAPLTPVSVAGVARRTTRRTVAATAAVTTTTVAAATIATLPAGCVPTIYSGLTYHHCGAIYYKPVYDGPNVVYVETAPPH